ncbi:MAG: hypothetical protein Q7K57_19590 [Burkholderiaceae bacterium]|nr:hypothetical protein [Burkholderiaceae bacterium]
MSDTFTWSMSAIPHADSIGALRQDIQEAYLGDGKLAVGLVLDLLPINTPNAQEAIERGAFIFEKDRFSNSGDALRIEIFDPVLDTYFLEIPELWAGGVSVNGDLVSLVFDTPLGLEIPKLAALGVGRSKFQTLERMSCDRARLLSELVDTVNGNRTNLDVRLSLNAGPTALGLTGRLIGMSSDPCKPNESDPNWYVYGRINSPDMCIIHYGEVVYGGQMAYVRRFGPSTYDSCAAFARANCGLSHGGGLP